MKTIAALAVIQSVRAALSRVDGDKVTITRAEFEALASAVEKSPRRPQVSEAQAALPLDLPAPTPPQAFATGPLPGNLDPARLRELLAESPKTAKTIARTVRMSPATVKRALRLLPDVEIVSQRHRKHVAGMPPNVYGLTH